MPTPYSPPTHAALHSAGDCATDSEAEKTHSSVDFCLQLSNRLQSSLDVLDVLNHFYSMLKALMPTSGLLYRHAQKHLSLSWGDVFPHSACYKLQISRSFLGEVTLYRDQHFTQEELNQLETLLGLLMLPLRNALLYRDALEHSLRDSLTGIGNRSALDVALQREFTLAKRAETALSVVVADIDFFKQVNDTAGHATGDSFIKKAAQTIAATLRESDQVFRFGGEEFVVILSATAHGEAMQVAERIRAAIAATTLATKTGPLSLTMSLGVSTLAAGDCKETLFERADSALYRAKAAGRNAVISAEEN